MATHLEEVPRRPAKGAADDDDDDEGLGWCGTAVCGGFVLGSIFLLGLFLNRNAEPYRKLKVESFANDEVLRTVVWPQSGGSARGGPNGPDVDWAIFFYKPYCGACRRVRPVFHALARTTNATAHLRFGEVDCVKHRGVCSMLEVESQPRIRLYKAAGGAEAAKARMAEKAKPGGSRVQNRWRRESAAEWQGMLIAYEISSWFERLQADGLLSSLIEWPSRDAAAAALREYKAKGDSQHDLSTTVRPKDPAGYLHDARLALEQGLTDHVFLAVAAADQRTKPAAAASGSADAADAPAKKLELGGSKLKRLRSWIALQSDTFPQRAVRLKLAALHAALGGRGKWVEPRYDALLTKHGFATQPAEPSEWRWC